MCVCVCVCVSGGRSPTKNEGGEIRLGTRDGGGNGKMLRWLLSHCTELLGKGWMRSSFSVQMSGGILVVLRNKE